MSKPIPVFVCKKCRRYFVNDVDCDDGEVIPGHPMKVLLEQTPDPVPTNAEEFQCDLDGCGRKPFGWAVTVLLCDKMVKVESNSEEKAFHYRGSKSTAISRAKAKLHFWKLVSVEPVTEEQWRRSMGNPEERGL